jgi:hypothetical protein
VPLAWQMSPVLLAKQLCRPNRKRAPSRSPTPLGEPPLDPSENVVRHQRPVRADAVPAVDDDYPGVEGVSERVVQ